MSSGGKLRQFRNLNENLHISDEYDSELCRTTIRGALWKGFYSDMMNVAKEGNVEYKNGKKPIRLIKQLLKWANLSDDDIVLDFFGGSSSTGHAVLSYNREYNKKIRYVLVQLPVNISKKSEYKTICELGKQRLRSVSQSYISQNVNIDVGFKVYRENCSNFAKYKPVKGQTLQALDEVFISLESMVDPLIDGWKPENVLEEIKLRQGFALDCQVVEVKEVKSNRVWHLIDHDRPITLYVCLDETIDRRTVDSLNISKDAKFICLNSAIDDTSYARLADKNRIQTL